MKFRLTLMFTGALAAFSPALMQNAQAGQPAKKQTAVQSTAKKRTPGKWSMALKRTAVEFNKSMEAQRAARARAIRTESAPAAYPQAVLPELDRASAVPQPASQSEGRTAPVEGVTARDIQNEMARGWIASNTLQVQMQTNQAVMSSMSGSSWISIR